MAASSPPTKKISVPLSAPTFDPVIGASTYCTPLARTRSANFKVAEGEIVLEFPFAEAILDVSDQPVTKH